MEAAGFTDVAFADVREPVYYGPDAAAAARAVRRLREALTTHQSDDGVWFNSRAWIITARV